MVVSSFWNNGLATTAGAITWGNGSTGITGPVTSTNSLVGTTTGDSLGSHGGTALTNGNYVVRSAFWDNGANANAGAVTWGDGSTGVTGAVSSSNSLVGTQASDFIGVGAITEISDGNYVNYVILNHSWNNGATADAGAVTWANGTTGITGTVSSSNSLVGTQTNDQVGLNGVVALANGNYVVVSSLWDNGATANAGAVTWGNGTTGISGTVSSSNSLVGTSTGDRVGISGVVALANGNYVVASTSWNNGGALEAGAATWGDGSTGVSGAVSSSNSLVGTTTFDGAGNVIALTNGNYVVISPNWDTGAALQAGAATWGNGTTGISGTISASNSLVGTMEDDQIGGGGVIALTNGNYVVISVRWRNGAATNAGAATWGDGTTGITGTVTSSNSLVGTTMNDDIGIGSVFALTNNNYVVVSPSWSDGATADVGAVTWGNGSTGIVGEVSSTNSLVGTQASDFVGFNGVTLLTNGNYVVNSNVWANGAATFAGAATWGNGTTGITGAVSQQNSIVGQVASSGFFGATEDAVNGTFICTFPDEGSGKVRVGLQSPNQIDFSRAQAQDMTITPSLLTDTLNTGTNVSIQANNDITISSAIASSPGAGALSLSAGRSAFINANITTNNGSLNITANDLLSSGVVNAYRDPGDAVLSVANGVTIDTGTGSLNLSLLNGAGKTNSGSGDLTIGDNATLQCSGSGAMTLTAQENNIALGNNSLLQTVNGTLMLSAVKDITDANPVTLQTTGAGELILITDSLFPTAPLFGNGKVTLPLATLTTAG